MPTFVYTKPIYPDHPEWNITWKLGTVKLRTDGRWSWWRHTTSLWPEWRGGEGVAITKMGACFRVQEGWLSREALKQMPFNPEPMADVYEYKHTIRGEDWWSHEIVLGRVIDTHTGVWTWVRHKSKYHPEWKPGKGTSRSCRLAHQNLMDGWE
jgi:hypothetical protein